MTKLKMAIVAAAGVSVVAAASLYVWLANQPAAVAQSGEGVVIATVNGEKIYRSEFEEAFDQLPPQAQQLGMETIYPMLVERMVDEKLVGIAAAKAVPADDAEVVKQVEALRKRVIMQIYFQREIDARLTEELLQKRYAKWQEENPAETELHARHILLETEEKAKAVLAEVQGGKDFAEAAKEHSTGPSGPNGGDLGFFTHDQMVKPFADAAFAMEAGQVSAAPIQTDFGWHVIKVEEKRQKPQPGFEEMRDQLAEEATQDVATEMLGALREGAKVETFNLDGTPIVKEAEQPAEGAEQPAQQ